MSFQMPLNPAVGIDLESYDGHAGIDFAVPENTPVIAAEGGRVVRAAPHRLGEPNNPSAFGNLVAILHDDGTVSLYAHLSAYETSNYTVGAEGQDRVEQGDVIGFSGNTGFVIGENGGFHLHFSILDLPEGVFINATGDSIFGFEPGFTGSMDVTESTFSLTSTPAAIASIAPAFVDQLPNDATTTAVLIDDGAEDSWTLTNAIEFAGDKDFIKFTAVAGEIYRVQVDGAIDRDIDELSDTFFRIRSALTPDQSIPETASDVHDDVVGTSAAISWTPDLSGDYFISVGAGGPDFASLHGGYSLSIDRENGSSGATAPALPGGAEKLLAGTFLARAVYGGGAIPNGFRNDQSDADEFKYDDDYHGYLSGLSTPWHVLTDAELGGEFFTFAGNTLGSFTSGGLYLGEGDTPLSWTETNKAEALLAWTLIDGQKTLVLSFRGSDGTDAFSQGQTFTASGAAAYYDALQPIIKATLAYAADPSNGISDVVVSGHSLAGTMADIFTLLDTTNPFLVGAKSFLDADIDISVVSLASAGVPRNIDGLLHLRDELITLSTGSGHIDAVTAPDFYTSINHSEDRVYYADETEGGLGLAFNSAITNDGGPFLPGNVNFASDLDIDLPNIGNTDVVYEGAFFFHGFGAEHNPELYWNNVSALLRDPLYGNFGNQNIIIGINDYDTKTADYDGSFLQTFEPFTGGFGADNDQGSQALSGTLAADYILGLSGDDLIIGFGGNDLLSGGEGNDILQGLLGRDILDGGKGDDILIGGGGAAVLAGSEGDTLFGGAGSDVFRYSAGDLPPLGTPEPVILPHGLDEIVDFNQGNSGFYDPSEADRIDLSDILGTVYASGAGENVDSLIRLRQSSFIDRVLLEIDVDGASSGKNWTPLALLSGLAPGGEVDFILDPASSTADEIVSVTGVPGSWQISPTSQSVIEGSGQIQFAVTRPNDTLSETVFISTTVVHGAQNEGDYDPFLNEAFTFQPGEASATFSIAIDDDGIAEVPETFGFIVQSSPDQSASDFLAAATFTIQDDDTIALGGTFTTGDDWIFIEPTFGTQTFNDLGGHDRATLDFSAFGEDLEFALVGTSGSTRQHQINTLDDSHVMFMSGVEEFQILSGSGNDTLRGDRGHDIILGNDGDDDLTGDVGNDGLFGGDGEDRLYGGTGTNVLQGGAGNDHIVSSQQAVGDAIDGGAGFDELRIDRRNVTVAETFTIDTRSGSVSFTLADGTTVTNIERLVELQTGSGNDDLTIILGAEGNHAWNANSGHDRATLDFSAFGEDLEFALVGTSGSTRQHQINTLDDSHVMFMSGVEEFQILSGSGNDTLRGDRGHDIILGNDGDDDLTGDVGNDGLFGGDGEDRLYGGTGTNVLQGGAGNDHIVSSQQAVGDAIDGGAGFDELRIDRRNVTVAETFTIDTRSGSVSFTLADGTTVTNIERLVELQTGSGNDDLTIILGAEGNHAWNANSGHDRATLDFSAFGEDLEFALVGTSGSTRQHQINTLDDSHVMFMSGVEEFQILSGSGNDTLRGDRGHDIILGNDGDDDLTGDVGNDGLFGGDGEDRLYGGTGTNVLQGGAGNDHIVSSQQAVGDAIDGGAGFDELRIDRRNVTVAETFTIDTRSGSVSFTLADGTTVTNIERLVELQTGSGNDDLTIILGAEGNHAWNANSGHDRATLDFSAFGEDLEFALVGTSGSTRQHQINTLDDSHVMFMSGVEEFQILSGSGNDTLRGDRGHDIILGNDGDDDLTGDVGNDGLFGGDGEDRLYGGTGTNVLQGGAGNDHIVSSQQAVGDAIDGGAGFDELRIDRRNVTVAETFTIDTRSGSVSFTLADGTTVTNIERLVELQTGSGNDDLTIILGAEGNHAWNANSGHDRATLDFSAFGEDLEFALVGTSGSTRQHQINTLDDSHVMFMSGVEEFQILSGSGNDTLRGDRGHDIILGNDGDDDLTGDVGNDGLFGGDGEDRLYGGTGTNVLQGGAGNDHIVSSQQAVGDAIDGGAGFDELRIDRRNVTVAETFTIDTRSGSVSFTLADGTTVTNIERLVELQTGSGNDDLTIILGAEGNHAWNANSGHDRATLDFSAFGEDLEFALVGTSGSTRQHQINTLDDSHVMFMSGVEEFQILSGSGNDTLRGDRGHDIILGNDGDDDLTGDVGNDGLFGGDGEDRLYGGTGNDTLSGNSGDDTLTGGAGSDLFVIADGPGNDTITDFDLSMDQIDVQALGLTFSQLSIDEDLGGVRVGYVTPISSGSILLENVSIIDLQESAFIISPAATGTLIIGTTSNDVLVGTALDEQIYGLAESDTLEGGPGGDTLDGGVGIDTATYATSVPGVTVRLDTGVGTGGDADGDSLTGIENLIGSEALDFLTGDGSNNVLQGLGGNDQLNGLAGSDTLDGGLGNDRFFVDSVDDVVIEAAGEGTDLITTSVDFTLAENVENASSSGSADIEITGNGLANFMTGNGGDNRLVGLAGADRLRGGAGNDTLEGGEDNDILEGQAGTDRFVMTANNGDDQIIGWEATTDVLDFETLGLRFADLRLTSSGNEALITFDDPAGGTGSVRLIDIDPEVLEIGIMSDPGGVGSGLGAPGGIPLVAGTSASENLAGTAAGEDLIGLAGNDTLNGRAGDDTMLGGFGDDRYLLDDAGDIALELEFQGIDQVDTRFDLVLGANIERAAVRGGGAVDITGNELDNFITGSDLQNVLIGGDGRDRLIARAGNDTLDGGLDRDVLEGGAGEDVFVFGADSDVDLITDFVVGEDLIDVSALGIAFADMTIVDGALGALVIFDAAPGSVDLVTLQGVSAADVRLASFTGAPNLPIVGTENDDVLRGTVEDDELQGLGGADQVDGQAGADTLIGGDGDDRYFVDDAGDVVIELASEGTDLVSSLVDFTLPEHVENGSALGTGDVDLTGNGLANALTGNDASNVLTGLDGDDNLQGKAGADTIDGGAGFDVLRGGADADVFVFAPGDGATGDQIIDFEVGVDTIDLTATGLGFGDLTIVDVGANALVTYGVDTLTVLNTTAAELDQNKFDLGA